MAFKQELANGIVKSIADLRKGDDLEDFTVIVDGVSVKCHRFILGACSMFFRAMFRSGMKESEENCVTLKGVSHPTFTLILTALYTGYDILSEENVFKVWRAAHMLQIGFLVEECEMYLDQNISPENYEEIYENAKLLDSDVLGSVRDFMLDNFDNVCNSQTFLNLSALDVKELIDSDELVVSSEDNVVKAVMRWISYTPPKTDDLESVNEMRQNFCEELPFYNDNGESEDDRMNRPTEDSSVSGNDANPDVENLSAEGGKYTLESKEKNLCGNSNDCPTQDQLSDTAHASGARSQNGQANELDRQSLEVIQQQTQPSENRQEHLLTLISSIRSCLLSPDFLETMLLDPSIVNNAVVREEALLKGTCYYLRIGRRHGQWPSAAIHRSCSHLQNLAVYTDRNNLKWQNNNTDVHAAHFFSNEIPYYKATFKSLTGNVVNFDNELYELTDSGLFVFRDGSWTLIINSPSISSSSVMVAVGSSIFFFCGLALWSLNPDHQPPVLVQHNVVAEAVILTAVTSFNELILMFGHHLSVPSVEETTVHTFDPSNGTWKKLENIQGPAKDLISFRTDNKTFLLQTNGSCWNVTSDENGRVIITFKRKLWDFHWELFGAVTYKDRLLIFGGMQTKENRERIDEFLEVDGERLYIYINCIATRVSVTPIIMEKKYFISTES